MKFKKTKFDDAWIIEPQVFQDERGFFFESFSYKWFEKKEIFTHFLQDNHAKSNKRGILRGLHFQLPPYTQTKLVRVVKGSVFDVIVDIRKESKTFGQWQGFELSEKNFLILYIPKGFAHGYCTLEDNTEFVYKVDNMYAPQSEGGIIWNDPEIHINWPVEDPVLVDRDRKWKKFTEQQLNF